MSSMGFLTRDGESRISGREYAKIECLVRDLAWNQVEQHFDLGESRGPSVLRDVVSWPEHVLAPGTFSFSWAAWLWMNTGSYPVNTPTAREVANTFETRINTVAADPSDPIALAARFAGQAQVNGWIDGPDRAWLADVIEQGMNHPYPEHLIGGRHDDELRGPLFSDAPHRKSHYDGWAAAAEMLRADDKGIVVLDYSVTDGFPDPQWASWPTTLDDPDERQAAWDAWDNVTPEQRWDDSERGLRAATERSPSRRITPTNLHTPGFGATEGHTWASLAEAWADDRAEKRRQVLRQAAERLRSPYLCNWDAGVAATLADWLEHADASDVHAVATGEALLASFGSGAAIDQAATEHAEG